MMRVCFVSLTAYGYFDPEVGDFGGGAQRQLSLIARELANEFNVHFIVGDYGQARTVRQDNITFHRAYEPDSGSQLFRSAALFAAMRRADADIYVYRGRPGKAAVVSLFARLFGSGWVYNLANDSNIDHQPEALSAPMQRLFEWALTNAHAVIAQTEYQATGLHERYGVSADIVPNGCPVATEMTPHDARDHVLWVGRLDAGQKRPHLYLDLAESLPNAEFLLVGPDGQDQAYTDRIRERASTLENVTDLGTVPPDEIHRYYREAVTLVNTSAYEGFPNTFLEAWRYETPVVSLDIDPGRFVDPEIDGYADGDPDRLAALVDRLVADPEERVRHGRPAGEFVRSSLAIDRVAAMYGSALRDALDSATAGT